MNLSQQLQIALSIVGFLAGFLITFGDNEGKEFGERIGYALVGGIIICGLVNLALVGARRLISGNGRRR